MRFFTSFCVSNSQSDQIFKQEILIPIEFYSIISNLRSGMNVEFISRDPRRLYRSGSFIRRWELWSLPPLYHNNICIRPTSETRLYLWRTKQPPSLRSSYTYCCFFSLNKRCQLETCNAATKGVGCVSYSHHSFEILRDFHHNINTTHHHRTLSNRYVLYK